MRSMLGREVAVRICCTAVRRFLTAVAAEISVNVAECVPVGRAARLLPSASCQGGLSRMDITNYFKSRSPWSASALRTNAGFVITIIAVLLLALLSPLALIVLSKASTQWTTLSNIGQAYGVLSAIALVGVAASIFFQARQERFQRMQMVRQYHLELRRMALESPEVYMPCWRPINAPDLDDHPYARRQHLYLHLTMTYALMSYEIGIMNDEALLNDLCAGIFKGEAGQSYWEIEGEKWELIPGSRRRKQFISIVNRAYDERPRKPQMGRTIDNVPHIKPSSINSEPVAYAKLWLFLVRRPLSGMLRNMATRRIR